MPVEPRESIHPDKRDAGPQFERLIGIDEHKGQLLDELHLLLRPDEIASWQKKHHAGVPELVKRFANRCPAVLLSGDVGCGKSALARTVGTPLADRIGARLKVIESPTDLRGGGHVGELSTRVTELFRKTRTMLGNAPGLL
ncbi:MAG TPA: hypothetical protein VMB50_12815, partial [Myxococcales bacterium]|nr:hypothetical protein [Myxococcales bacterium]